MHKHLISICARGGSKGIPGKNIRKLNGVPLIGYTIKTALKLAEKFNADIVLSTDSEKIKEVAEKFGLTSEYNRPASLAGDSVGKIDVFRDLLFFQENQKGFRYDYYWDLDVTSPLRTLEDLSNAFQMLHDHKDAYNIFSVSKANKNPYFNMVEEADHGYVKLVKASENYKCRQTAPVVYDMNASFYIFRRNYFDENFESSITPRSLFYLMPHVCFDIDEPLDFKIMELLLKENLLGFES